MARRDGTGPLGMGPMTGRGFGLCNEEKSLRRPRLGFRSINRRGFGRGYQLLKKSQTENK